MKRLRKVLRNMTPYGFVIARRHRKKYSLHIKDEQLSFLNLYEHWISHEKPTIHIDNQPKNIVSVQGFGHSGSGAVVDLLREYEGVVVVGNVDNDGSLSTRGVLDFEVDFARLSGGLFEIEKYITSRNLFLNDAVLHRFMLLIQNSGLFQFVPESRPIFFSFFEKLIIPLVGFGTRQCYNLHLDYGANESILNIQMMTLSEYRQLCNGMLKQLFSLYNSTNQEILVLDQFFSDYQYDMERKREYVPNLKTIIVYRDPRDIYTFAIDNNIEWIPHSDVGQFIRWYQIGTQGFDPMQTDDYLSIRFEDLVLDYDNTVKRIEEYIGISNNAHIRYGKSLDPSVSKKNIGLWGGDHIDLKDDYEAIKMNLTSLCFFGD